jgi:pyruvate/2-oxoglutarate dehydrogenase complex dihydrolipoamide dehydrogenase (E3) component
MPEIPTLQHYDAIILGSGQAANPLAVALAAKGKRTALVERGQVGGTCVNYGCTPTKTMVASAEVAYLAGRGAEFGVRTGPISIDMPVVRERKRAMVKSWREGSEKRIAGAKGLDLIRGEGSFVDAKTVRVRLNAGGEGMLTAGLIVIDTGVSGSAPPLPGLEGVPYLDNASVMELDRVPEHLLVLGGGYIGLEFAQMFRRFGSRVTVVQNSGQLLPNEDEDLAEEIAKFLREEGIEILLSAEAETASHADGVVELKVRIDGAVKTIRGSDLLVATGRKPNTSALNLAAAGIATNARGFVQVNERLETSVAGVYATGDVTGGPEFTHVAYDDYRILKENLLEGGSRSTKDRILPYCVFLDPQLGRVGLSEKEAAAQGVKVRIAKMPMTSVARALETSQTRGFIKALVDPKTQQIVGAAVLGLDGGEVMSMLQIAMMGKLPYTTLKDAVLAHPSLAECLNNLFGKFEDE